MAKFIPYTLDNIFLWYEGNDPDRATPFNGVNLNTPTKQLEENDEKLDQTIQDYANGVLKATHLKTTDLDVDNNLKLNTANLKNSGNDIFITDENNKNNIDLHLYKIDTTKLKLNGVNIDYNNEFLEVTDDDSNYKNIKCEKIDLNIISFRDKVSALQVNVGTINEEKVNYLDFKSSEGYKSSFIRSGSFYALNSYYNFGSDDLQDAIVYDDQDDSNTANSFLFYADGKVENSTIIAGDVKTVGADVAEFYDADKDYEIGTVLEIGGKKEVTEYNGNAIAGIVSEKPGSILNQNNNFEYPILIALKGRVRVKIEGEIKKGEYVIAYKNGKGISSKEYVPGRTLGVALENGKNLVLIKV